ncbi:NAD(P)-dependent oxidoreductase [Litchfieldella rifensis]|uniref:NAD(P)-dependent oxidoreductase n=1 Tax=Litchfieldella rifensis TaxID=762643 RepID=A0ABV7LUX9_9GAMM
MNIVFLDSETVPKDIPAPAWTERWDNLALAPDESTVEALKDADIAITNKVKITRRDLERLPRLKYVCVAASGYDCVDLEACRDHEVVVANSPDYSSNSVAETVIALIYALRRRLIPYAEASHDRWPESSFFCVHLAPILDVQGATLGIVGRGDIGNRVAQLAEAVGMKVMFAERKGATTVRSGHVAFEDVLRQSDILTLHCPAVPGVDYLIGKRELFVMKQGTYLVNTSRGTLVDADAVLASLDQGHLGGAALDVLASEPPPKDHPLIRDRHPNLIVTPHIAWASQTSIDNLIKRILENLEGFHSKAPINTV